MPLNKTDFKSWIEREKIPGTGPYVGSMKNFKAGVGSVLLGSGCWGELLVHCFRSFPGPAPSSWTWF